MRGRSGDAGTPRAAGRWEGRGVPGAGTRGALRECAAVPGASCGEGEIERESRQRRGQRRGDPATPAAEAPRPQPGPRGESGQRTARQRQGAVLPPQGGATSQVTSHACAASSAGPGSCGTGAVTAVCG